MASAPALVLSLLLGYIILYAICTNTLWSVEFQSGLISFGWLTKGRVRAISGSGPGGWWDENAFLAANQLHIKLALHVQLAISERGNTGSQHFGRFEVASAFSELLSETFGERPVGHSWPIYYYIYEKLFDYNLLMHIARF